MASSFYAARPESDFGQKVQGCSPALQVNDPHLQITGCLVPADLELLVPLYNSKLASHLRPVMRTYKSLNN